MDPSLGPSTAVGTPIASHRATGSAESQSPTGPTTTSGKTDWVSAQVAQPVSPQESTSFASKNEETSKSSSLIDSDTGSEKNGRRTPQTSDRDRTKSPSSRDSRGTSTSKGSSKPRESPPKDTKSPPVESNRSGTPTKREGTFLPLPLWRPDDSVDACMICGSGFNPLLLRWKHHCRACGDIFCGNCTRLCTLPLYGILHEEVRVCSKCYDKEMERRQKDQRKKDKQDQRKLDDQKLQDLFAQLAKAYEDSDEERAIQLKAQIDVLRDVIYKKEERRQAAKKAKLEALAAAKRAKEEEKQRKSEKTEKSKSKKKTTSSRDRASSNPDRDSRASKPLLSPFGDQGSTPSLSAPGDAASTSGLSSFPPSVVGSDGSISVKVSSEPDTPEQIAAKLAEKVNMPFQKLLNPPSAGKCCLVLDVDYTLFDHLWHLQVKEEFKKDKSQIIPEFQRPYLHQFLQTCYEKYDLVIWSATGFVAIDSKLTNLGIYDNPNYKITLVLSKEHMITVKHRKKKGGVYEETVKPLEVLWKNFPGVWTPANTIHIDDMSPNFQLNPQNGLAIAPYKDASRLRDDDLELMYLTKYLLLISKEEKDFAALNHKQWKEYIISKLWQKQTEYAIPQLEIRTPFDRNLLLETGKSSKKASSSNTSTNTGGSSSSSTDAALLPPAPTEPAPPAPGSPDLLSFETPKPESENPFAEVPTVTSFNPFAEDALIGQEATPNVVAAVRTSPVLALGSFVTNPDQLPSDAASAAAMGSRSEVDNSEHALQSVVQDLV